ncbi:DUF7674 family protein [Cellulomonas terrae]|uniref:DUF7674 domain-containing protein n=1 Tax=Cellulomonas terrae TaxID=311234 RepID=A0A511JLX5_9CELL|nr:hypothetical protein [Cellulomonas terrae]GEL99001.1 hypothetical protein CTE05_25480 [Cellulomonas terrae]
MSDHHEPPMTKEDFVRALAEVPGAGPIIDEHYKDMEGELLGHLLMADMQRFAEDLHRRGDTDTLHLLLAVVDAGFRTGDEYLVNAVEVSFVENTLVWDPAYADFIAAWPAALQVVADSQGRWRPPSPSIDRASAHPLHMPPPPTRAQNRSFFDRWRAR